MSIASYFFVGSQEDAVRNDGLEGGSDERRALFYRVMDTGLKPLFEIITGSDCPKFEPLSMTDEFDVITFAFPVEFTDALAVFDDSRCDSVISEWKTKTDVPYDNDSDLRDLLAALVRLGRVAKETGLNMYLWNCL